MTQRQTKQKRKNQSFESFAFGQRFKNIRRNQAEHDFFQAFPLCGGHVGTIEVHSGVGAREVAADNAPESGQRCFRQIHPWLCHAQRQHPDHGSNHRKAGERQHHAPGNLAGTAFLK